MEGVRVSLEIHKDWAFLFSPAIALDAREARLQECNGDLKSTCQSSPPLQSNLSERDRATREAPAEATAEPSKQSSEEVAMDTSTDEVPLASAQTMVEDEPELILNGKKSSGEIDTKTDKTDKKPIKAISLSWLFLGGLPDEITLRTDLHLFLSRYGTIEDMKMMPNLPKRSRSALVLFTSRSDARRVAKKLNGTKSFPGATQAIVASMCSLDKLPKAPPLEKASQYSPQQSQRRIVHPSGYSTYLPGRAWPHRLQRSHTAQQGWRSSSWPSQWPYQGR